MEPAPLRLSRSARLDRERAFLFGAAAALSVVTSIWLFALPFTVPRLFGVAGIAFAWLFVRRARAALCAAGDRASSFLELGSEALRVCDLHATPRLDAAVPWTRIAEVEVDEERLVVALRGEQRDALLELEPSFGELGLYDLCDAVTAAWRASRARSEVQAPGCNPSKAR